MVLSNVIVVNTIVKASVIFKWAIFNSLAGNPVVDLLIFSFIMQSYTSCTLMARNMKLSFLDN